MFSPFPSFPSVVSVLVVSISVLLLSMSSMNVSRAAFSIPSATSPASNEASVSGSSSKSGTDRRDHRLCWYTSSSLSAWACMDTPCTNPTMPGCVMSLPTYIGPSLATGMPTVSTALSSCPST